MKEKIPVKAGLKRVWILISILWALIVFFVALSIAISIFNNGEHATKVFYNFSDLCAKLETNDNDFRKMDVIIHKIRQKYPQYNDMTDQQLADAVHNKIYSDMSKKADFLKKIDFIPVNPTPKDFLISNCIVDPWDHDLFNKKGLYNINKLRLIFPSYKKLSNKQLIDTIHDKYYTNLSKNEYYRIIGYKPTYQVYLSDISSATQNFAIAFIFRTSPIWLTWLIYWAYIGFPVPKRKNK